MVPDTRHEVAGRCVGRGEKVADMSEELHAVRIFAKRLFILDGISD